MEKECDVLSIIAPLTHPDPRRPGHPYKRFEDVDKQILEALSLEPEALIARAGLLDYEDPKFLKPECLVYLLREFHRAGDHYLVNGLTTALIKRCAKHINNKVQGSIDRRYVDDCFNEAVAAIFGPILDLSSDGADFAQVRFWVVLDYQLINIIKKFLGRQADDMLIDSLDTDLDRSDKAPPPPEWLRVEGDGAFNEVALSEALVGLGEPHRTVLLMRHLGGWEIENKNPNVLTISRHFKRSPKTIQRWLAKAEEHMRLRRGEN